MVPTFILPAVPAVPLYPPCHPVMMRVSQGDHDWPLLAAKLSVWEPVPKAMVEVASRVNVPTVSVNPVVAPVLKVPPDKMTLLVLAMRSAAPKTRVPALMVVVPV